MRIILFMLFAVWSVSEVQAGKLIELKLDEGEGVELSNTGSLPDARIEAAGRPIPNWVTPGVGGKGAAVAFTNEQTGRPDYYQAIQIPSDGVNTLRSWTLAFWFKLDTKDFNPANPVGDQLAMTVFATAYEADSGLLIGLNKARDGTPQIYIQMGDGLHDGKGWFNFSPRENVFDGQWAFASLVFDANRAKNKFRIYGGDEVLGVTLTTASDVLDKVDNSGSGKEQIISIGDGLGPFSNTSSMIGAVDHVIFIDEALDDKAIEELRLQAVSGEGGDSETKEEESDSYAMLWR